jgi:hypothetical protein
VFRVFSKLTVGKRAGPLIAALAWGRVRFDPAGCGGSALAPQRVLFPSGALRSGVEAGGPVAASRLSFSLLPRCRHWFHLRPPVMESRE